MISIKPDIDEALRFLGAQDAPETLRQQAAEAAAELAALVQPKYFYQVYDLKAEQDGFCLAGSGVTLTGGSAKKMLSQCGQAALLACTLGARFDLHLLSVQARDMARAVLLDACASALVEQGCDAAEQELSARLPGVYLTDRFSPGYGDLPLSVQPGICAALDASRRLGLHVTEHLLLNPVKSVTAVIGLSDRPQMARIRGCAFCALRETCPMRRQGKDGGCRL